jgi:methyl-accepting chemotaxis protein
MIRNERRRHFFINRPLQLRYMFTITFALLAITAISLTSFYFGIWGGILDAFSDERTRNDLLTASRLQQYEEARHPRNESSESFSPLSFIRQAERLSERQREVFKEILDQTNRGLTGKLLLLFALIAWGTIYLSHKIAGPLYHFQMVFNKVAQGDLAARCHLRKFDEAKSVAAALNAALETLDQEFVRLKQIVKENPNDAGRLTRRLDEELSRFKTSDSQ